MIKAWLPLQVKGSLSQQQLKFSRPNSGELTIVIAGILNPFLHPTVVRKQPIDAGAKV